MTDATAAPVEDAGATAATATAETTDATASSTTSATDAAGERSASAEQTGSSETDDVPELTALTKEERKQYSEALKRLDPAHRKTLNRLFDEKAKSAATARKQIEELGTVAQVLQQIESDPEGTIAQLQARFVKPKAGNGSPPPIQVTEEEIKAVEATLDDASKPLAKAIAPAVIALMRAQLQPLQEFVRTEQDNRRAAEAHTALLEFEKANQDWKEFEPAMLELGKKIPPGQMPTGEYLQALYTLASASAKQKAAGKVSAERVLEKVAKAAANAEPDTTSVSPARVSKKPPQTVAEAFAMAQRGETVED